MRGCSHLATCSMCGKRKHSKKTSCGQRGGSECLPCMRGGSTDVPLAYTGHSISSSPNPYLAYTGKGGKTKKRCVKGGEKQYYYPTPTSNMAFTGKGGSPVPNLNASFQAGGKWFNHNPLGRVHSVGRQLIHVGHPINHTARFKVRGGRNKREGKNKRGGSRKKRGGGVVGAPAGASFYNNSAPYPNGLVGQPWTANGGWPGTTGISGDNNYLKNNTYSAGDPQTVNVVNERIGGGRRSRRRRRSMRGGINNSILPGDLANVGRSFVNTLQNTSNTFMGKSAAVDPMPYNGHLPNTVDYQSIRILK